MDNSQETNELFSDTVHSERFMGFASPEDNESGYDVCLKVFY